MISAPFPEEQQQQTVAFDSLNLQVGLRLQFLVHRAIKPVPYFSTLIGYIKDEYLIVRTPVDNGNLIGLVDGERITIRVFSGTSVCSFVCTVERIFPRPLSYVHLSFPTSIRATSLRSAMRVRTDIPVQITPAGAPDASAYAGTLMNVSVSGGRIDVDQPFDVADMPLRLQLSITLPSSQQDVPLQLEALVRNTASSTRPHDQAAVHSYGVEFIDVDVMQFTLLQNLTYEALLTDRTRIV